MKPVQFKEMFDKETVNHIRSEIVIPPVQENDCDSGSRDDFIISNADGFFCILQW